MTATVTHPLVVSQYVIELLLALFPVAPMPTIFPLCTTIAAIPGTLYCVLTGSKRFAMFIVEVVGRRTAIGPGPVEGVAVVFVTVGVLAVVVEGEGVTVGVLVVTVGSLVVTGGVVVAVGVLVAVIGGVVDEGSVVVGVGEVGTGVGAVGAAITVPQS